MIKLLLQLLFTYWISSILITRITTTAKTKTPKTRRITLISGARSLAFCWGGGQIKQQLTKKQTSKIASHFLFLFGTSLTVEHFVALHYWPLPLCVFYFDQQTKKTNDNLSTSPSCCTCFNYGLQITYSSSLLLLLIFLNYFFQLSPTSLFQFCQFQQYLQYLLQ